MTKNQSYIISLLRLPLITLVIFLHISWPFVFGKEGHTLHMAENTLFNIFHIIPLVCVPVFYFISGFLFYDRYSRGFSLHDYWEEMKKKFFSLVIPYIMWYLIAFLCCIAIYIKKNVGLSLDCSSISLDSIISNIDLLPFTYHLWFVRELIIVFVLTPIIYFLVDKVNQKLLILLLIFYFIFDPRSDMGLLSCQSTCFFMLGALSALKKITINIVGVTKYLLYISWITLFLINLFTKDSYFVYSKILSHIFILISIPLLYHLLFNKITRTTDFFCKLSKYSFFVYLSHVYILSLLIGIERNIISDNIIMNIISYILLPVIVTICCILLYKLFYFVSPSIIFFLAGNRKK